MSTELDRARVFAEKAHAGQFRRDGITPYIEHSKAVASRVGTDENAQAVAWLHDVIEDTKITLDDLERAGFTHTVLKAVAALTKDHAMGYDVYLDRVRRNHLARRVKIADILHNLSDQPTSQQIVKYSKALLFLVHSP